MKSKTQKYEEAVARNMRFAGAYVKEDLESRGVTGGHDYTVRGKVIDRVKVKIGIRKDDEKHDLRIDKMIPEPKGD